VEGDFVGDMTGHVLLEGGTPYWNRYASEEAAAHRWHVVSESEERLLVRVTKLQICCQANN